MDDGKTPTDQDATTQPQTTESSTQFTQTDTYVAPSPEPVAAAPLAITEKKPSRAGKWLLWGFVVLLLAGLAAFSYWQWTEAENAKSQSSSLESALATANNTDTAANTNLVDGKDFVDESAVSAAAMASVEAFMNTKGVSRMTYEASISYIDDNFARVHVDYTLPDSSNGKTKPSGKGEVFYFEKVTVGDGDPTWAMIGINPITADEMNSMKSRYGVPEQVITGTN